MKETLYLYIWKEILPIFFIGLMTFTIILQMDGNIHRFDPKANAYQKMQFDAYDLRIEI